MRSRPDPVSGTTSIRPSAASTEDSPRSAPLPVVHNGVFHEVVRRSIESALQLRLILAPRDRRGQILVLRRSCRRSHHCLSTRWHSIGDVGAGPATLDSCAHNLPIARAYGDLLTSFPFPFPRGIRPKVTDRAQAMPQPCAGNEVTPRDRF